MFATWYNISCNFVLVKSPYEIILFKTRGVFHELYCQLSCEKYLAFNVLNLLKLNLTILGVNKYWLMLFITNVQRSYLADWVILLGAIPPPWTLKGSWLMDIVYKTKADIPCTFPWIVFFFLPNPRQQKTQIYLCLRGQF